MGSKACPDKDENINIPTSGNVKIVASMESGNNSHRLSSWHYFHSLKILMNGYVLASILEEKPYCSMHTAKRHLQQVEEALRIDAGYGGLARFNVYGADK